MAADVLIGLAGLVLLVLGSDWMVAGGSRLAARRGIPPVVVGAVILGFGTSLPELVVGLAAAVQGDSALGIGGIVGSNAANLGLVLGVAAVAVPISADRSAWRRVPLAVVAVGLLAAFLLTGGVIERWEGGVLLAAMAFATGRLLRDPDATGDPSAPEAPDSAAGAPPAAGDGEASGSAAGEGSGGAAGDLVAAGETVPVSAAAAGADVPEANRLDRRIDALVVRLAPRSRGELWRLLAGLGAIVAGAQLSVNGFTGIAARLGIASGLVGLSLVAVGTSLPELATAIAGIRQGQPLLTLGNLLGSNIFNSLAIGGLVAVVRPGGLGSGGVPWVAAFAMLGITLLATAFLATHRPPRLTRWEGAVLLVAYAAALPLILLSS